MKILRLVLVSALVVQIAGAVGAQSPPGNGNFLRFDGVDGVAATAQWPSPVEHTIEAWVRRPTADPAPGSMIAGHTSIIACTTGYGFRWRDTVTYQLNLAPCGVVDYSLEASTAPNTWYHYAGTFDGQTIRLYENGVLADELINCGGGVSCWGSGDTTPYFQIGALLVSSGYDYFFQGEIDDVRLWDHARTQAEIAQNMSNPLTGMEPGLIGYWPFNEGQGTTTLDLASGGHHATLLGGVSWATYTIGTNYCGPANFNSTGQSAVISAFGNTTASVSLLELTATQLPQNVFGYFLNSDTQGFKPFPPGSNGNLCLGGGIGRHVKQVGNSGAAGELVIDVDLTVLPRPGGTHSVVAGETWNFQCWFRDNQGGPTSNFTDGIEIVFQ